MDDVSCIDEKDNAKEWEDTRAMFEATAKLIVVAPEMKEVLLKAEKVLMDHCSQYTKEIMDLKAEISKVLKSTL